MNEDSIFGESADQLPFGSPGLPADDSDQRQVSGEDCEPSAESPSWLTDELIDSAEAEHAAWLAALPTRH